MKYIDKHSHLLEHYIHGSFGGLYLGFLEDWRLENLPENSTHNGLRIVLKDANDGKLN